MRLLAETQAHVLAVLRAIPELEQPSPANLSMNEAREDSALRGLTLLRASRADTVMACNSSSSKRLRHVPALW